MIHTDIFHHTWENTGKVTRSHRLQPSEWVTIFCILTGEKESIISILEDHLLESISWIEWEGQSLGTDFTFISENFNHFIQNIDIADRASIGVLFAVLIGEELVFSHIGDTSILLVEADGNINNLSNNDPTLGEFQAISSGEVLAGSHVYLSSSPLENRLSDDIIRDLSWLNEVEWKNIIADIFKKEIQETIHVWHIYHERIEKVQRERRWWKQLDILRTSSREMLSGLHVWEKLQKIQNISQDFFVKKQKETKYVFLIAGVVLLFSLLYLLFSALFSVVSSPERDSKSQLIKAQELIDNSQKIINNPVAFNKTIEEAEAILFELRDKRVYMTDTQSLLSRIEAMKKEVNDVQTIDVSKLNSIMSVWESGISPIGVYEYDKKLNLIGKNWALLGFARGGSLPTVKSYPTGATAKDFDSTEDGGFFILTEEGKIMSQRGTEISYVTTSGKNEWQASTIVGTFNGNLYLAGSGNKILNRYKPGINGFSTASTIIWDSGESIVDIGIDGGIYVLLQNGKVIRYIGWSTTGQKSLNINKVPWEYTLGSEDVTKVFVRQNLAYTYVLSGRNIWIFSPDSKRFQDVTAWNYVAQLELQTSEEVRNISIPRDGIIYIVTDKSVYELGFEIADGKIILR